MSHSNIRPARRRHVLARVKPDCTIVLLGSDNKPYIEVRPHYEPGTGPTLVFYRVNLFDAPSYLATLPLPVVGALVQKLPIAIAAARRLANGSTKPNVKPGSSRS